MDYSSPGFIFFALFGLILFYAIRSSARFWLLLVMSILWVYSWKPEWAILYFGILNLNYLILRSLRRIRKGFLTLAIFNLILYAVLKSPFAPSFLGHPYGLSFFMFMVIGLILDEWRNEKTAVTGWRDFLLMPLFFPFLMAGPIERGRHFLSELNKENHFRVDLPDAVLLFSFGFLKRVILVPPLKVLLENILSQPLTPVNLIYIGFLGTLNIYVELSSYATMGRGIAKAFGIDVPLSFRPIYYSKNPADFWARWNITLGTWIRDYFTFPMMLKFGRKVHPQLLIIFAFLIVGIWHAVEWKWILFGLFNGLMIVLYNLTARGRLLALIILLGNGLILAGPLNPEWRIHYYGGLSEIFEGTFSWVSGVFLITTFLIELVEEKKNDQDWFLKFSLKGKMLAASFLLLMFFWALEADVLTQQTGIELPVYFKL